MTDAVPGIPPLSGLTIARASADAVREIERQDQLAREGRFGGLHTLPGGPDDARLAVLTEELGEVARELNEARQSSGNRGANGLYIELIQLAASSIAWGAAILEGRPR